MYPAAESEGVSRLPSLLHIFAHRPMMLHFAQSIPVDYLSTRLRCCCFANDVVWSGSHIDSFSVCTLLCDLNHLV